MVCGAVKSANLSPCPALPCGHCGSTSSPAVRRASICLSVAEPVEVTQLCSILSRSNSYHLLTTLQNAFSPSAVRVRCGGVGAELPGVYSLSDSGQSGIRWPQGAIGLKVFCKRDCGGIGNVEGEGWGGWKRKERGGRGGEKKKQQMERGAVGRRRNGRRNGRAVERRRNGKRTGSGGEKKEQQMECGKVERSKERQMERGKVARRRSGGWTWGREEGQRTEG